MEKLKYYTSALALESLGNNIELMREWADMMLRELDRIADETE